MALQTTVQTLNLSEDYSLVEDFFNKNFIANLWQEVISLGKGEDFIDQYGVFKGRLISCQKFISPENVNPLLESVLDQLRKFFVVPIVFREIVYSTLYLPWDIHCDLVRTDSDHPFYNVLIPLHDVNSRTVIFNQKSPGYNDFYKYKKEFSKIKDCISEDFWNEYLSMCWAEDREYLSLKALLPEQRAGQLIMFKRDLWHSSDNFHLKHNGPKHFIQIIVDKQ